MFNFTTTTIVNSVVAEDYKVITKDGNKTLFIKNVGSFGSDVKATKRAYMPEVKPEVTLTMPAVTAGDVYRLTIDIELYKSDSSLYARPWPTKGKPLYVEVIAPSANAVEFATALVANANKYMNLVYDKEIVSISQKKGSGEALTADVLIAGTEGSQVFKSVILEKWDKDDNAGDTYAGGEWVSVSVTKSGEKKGFPGFGTYSHMVHNVVLPTYENIRYGNAVANSPKIDGNYSQVVITMEKERDPYGTGAVGQKLTSVTQHVFWVADAALSAFTAKLTELGVTPKAITSASDPAAAAASEASVLDE